MTKKEFVAAFAEKGGLKLKDSERLVNAFLETVEGALLAGNGVRFIGFGSWEVKKREAIIWTIWPTATSTEFGSNIFAFPILHPPFNITSISTSSQFVSLNNK